MTNLSDHLPSAINNALPAINHYGYVAVLGLILLEDFGLFFIPGESVLIAAAFLAGAGKLNIVGVIVVAIVGAFLGDNIGFAIGRFGGRKLVERWGRYIFITPKRIDRVEAFFKRQGPKLILFARFIELLRQLNGVIAGISDMEWLVFVKYNGLGAILWVVFWSMLGYFGGSHISLFLEYQLYFTIGVIVLLIVYIATRLITKKRVH